MRILPGVLKELVKHIPSVLFKTVEWSELASEFPKISRRMLQKDGYEEIFHAQKQMLDPYNIVLTDEHLKGSLKNNKEAGEKILTLYFAQLHSSQGLFLDLRSSHFSPVEQGLKWHPTSLWTKLNENFRQGLLKVYEGFYLEKEDLYHEGLEEIGLLKKEFTQEDHRKLGDLFRAQFGESENMKFELEHFKDSIIKMSEFMLQKEVSISKDFLYLGIYLVTLYSALEETEERYPVKDIYLDVRGRFSARETR